MKKILGVSVLMMFCFSFLFGAAEFDAKLKAEAKKMVADAVAYYKTNGQASIKDFQENKDGKWMKGSLYVFMFDENLVCLVHPANKALVGKNLTELKDRDGKFFMKEMLKNAKSKEGQGWNDYYWPNPDKTGKPIEPKSSFVIGIDGGKNLIGVGIYGSDK